MRLQTEYQDVLRKRMEIDTNFQQRIREDIVARREMYGAMYGGVLDKMMVGEKMNFLTERTLRTMAQYLVLARLVAENSSNPVIISHPTRNTKVYNELGDYELVGEAKKKPSLLPVLEIERKIY